MFLSLTSRLISVLGVIVLFTIVLMLIKWCICDFLNSIKNHGLKEGTNEKNSESSIHYYGDDL